MPLRDGEGRINTDENLDKESEGEYVRDIGKERKKRNITCLG